MSLSSHAINESKSAADMRQYSRPAEATLTRKRTAYMMAALVALSSTTVAAEPPDLTGTHWKLAAEQAGVDPLMLYAVALTESGRSTVVKYVLSPNSTWPSRSFT